MVIAENNNQSYNPLDAIRHRRRSHGKHHDPLPQLQLPRSVQNDHRALRNPIFLPLRRLLGPSLFQAQECQAKEQLEHFLLSPSFLSTFSKCF